MIVPAVVAFNGGDPSGINAGPGLMFGTLPQVFERMWMGHLIGGVFFLLVLFAALTSSISLDGDRRLHRVRQAALERRPATVAVTLFVLLLGLPSCLGYGPLASVQILGMAFLDFFDFISNSVLMPHRGVLHLPAGRLGGRHQNRVRRGGKELPVPRPQAPV